MHSRTQIDQPVGRCYQSRQQVGREHVDGEDVREAIDGLDAVRLPITDTGIMDRRVVPAQRVDLLGDSPHLGDARQVADNDILGLGQRATRVRRTRFVARV